MNIYDIYGANACSAAELARIVADRLGLTFAGHESDYRGICYSAEAPPCQIEVQPNAIPGDDGQNDLYAPDHPCMRTRLLVTGSQRSPGYDARLNALDALQPLERESS
ncbi:hypothetical protein [Dactylosporangium sp. NPDC006015]|uniref:hypothetical protein n=1 Tax=Dactylosporangium sp. NPDC006015 TaxID=3154576 RepID=UPI0033BA3E14